MYKGGWTEVPSLEIIARDGLCQTFLFNFQEKLYWQNNISWVKKCTVLQALMLCTGRTAHRGSRDIAVLFLDHGTRRKWGVSATPRPLFTPGKDPVPILQVTGWAPRPVWTGAENLAPTRIRCQDRPARSQSLYRLSYRARNSEVICCMQSFIWKVPLWISNLS